MLIDTIKEHQLKARKAKDAVTTALLTTLIGEAEAVGKKEQRAPNDAEVIATVKKFMKGVDEIIEKVNPETSGYQDAVVEKAILELYLPKQFNEKELTEVVTEIINNLKSKTTSSIQMGMVMGALKIGYDGQYDGKMASTVVKAVLAGQ